MLRCHHDGCRKLKQGPVIPSTKKEQGMLLSTQEMHNIDDGSMLRRFGSPLLVSQFNHGNHVFDELFGFRCWSAASTQSSTLGAYTCSLIII